MPASKEIRLLDAHDSNTSLRERRRVPVPPPRNVRPICPTSKIRSKDAGPFFSNSRTWFVFDWALGRSNHVLRGLLS